MADSHDKETCKSDESVLVQLSNSDSDKEDTVFFTVNMLCIKMNRLQTAPIVVIAKKNIQKQA